mgnify:CR=1 FL=1
MVAAGTASAMPSNSNTNTDLAAFSPTDPTLDPASLTDVGLEDRAELADRSSRSGRSAVLPPGKRQAPRDVWVLPVKNYELTSNFGPRWGTNHNGLDLAAPIGTPVLAAHDGVVVRAGWYGGYGYAVDIDHGNGIMTRYGHNSAVLVSVGEYVRAGQQIAKMGSTGYSTGPHLHFEIHVNGSPVDPIPFLLEEGVDVKAHRDSIYISH